MPTSEENQIILDDVSWDAIIGSIQQQRCIICIGPGVYTENKVSLEAQLIEHLKPHADRLRIRVYEDGWIHYLPGHNVLEPYMKIKEFYKKPFPAAQRILEKLVQIPFHFYITSTPDQKLREAFQGYTHRFDFYFKNKPYNPDGELEIPTSKAPLVYNICGEIDNRESLVLTYDDFYNYLESVISGKSMASKIRESIHDADNFIFIGLPFDQWYMHLFLRIMEQHKNKNQLKYAPSSYIPEKVQTYCNDQFNITFVPLNEETFVNLLFQKCQENNLLRTRQYSGDTAADFPSEPIKNLIRSNEIEAAFDAFFQALAPYSINCKKVLDGLSLLSAQFKNLKERYNLGIVSNDDYNRERATVNYGLMNLVNEAETCAKTR